MTEHGTLLQPLRRDARRMARLTLKELREILRDRRTVITLVLMPLIVYPLLGVLLRKAFLSSLQQLSPPIISICLENEEAAVTFEKILLAGRRLSGERVPADESREKTSSAASVLTDSADMTPEFGLYVMEFPPTELLEQRVARGNVELGVRLHRRPRSGKADTPGDPEYIEYELIRQKGSRLSDQAFRQVSSYLQAYNNDWAQRVLSQHALPARLPATITASAIEPFGRRGSSLVTFVPLVLVLMTMTGAVYPAIDLTAGERERGTMEILIAAPVPRLRLLGAKFVAVLAVALLTASINLFAMFATMFVLGIEGAVLGESGLAVIPRVAALLVVFAGFFSAVLLSLTSFARSFKEAQAYLIPLMLISLTPGIFSLMPEIRMNPLLAITPLVNTVLMGRDLLEDRWDTAIFAIVLISTALYGLLALAFAARVVGSDGVLNNTGGTWSDLFRRPKASQPVPSMSLALFCTAILFPLFIVLGTIPGRLPATMAARLGVSALITLTLFSALPVLLALAGRVRLQSGLALYRPHWKSLAAAALLGSSLWMFLYEIEIATLTRTRLDTLKSLFESLKVDLNSVPLWLKLLTLSVTPAVCEELFFRGFLQSAFRRHTSVTGAVCGSAILFATFHVVVRDTLLFERVIPSLLMGLVLGFVCVRSGSLFPGMLLHMLHNGLLITVSAFESTIRDLGVDISGREHLPFLWLAGSLVPIVIGTVLLCRNTPNSSAERMGGFGRAVNPSRSKNTAARN